MMRRAIRYFVVLLAMAFLGGFGAFAAWVTSARPPDQAPRADAIVALTGGGGARISTASRLLSEGAGARLLVSGVNPSVTDDDVRQLAGLDAALFDCCVDLGRTAASTVGNAREVAEWARTHGYDSLIIVTSDFHMPRSMIVLRGGLDGVDLHAYPVPARGASKYPWWRDAGALRRMSVEYVKFLIILSQEALRAPASKADR